MGFVIDGSEYEIPEFDSFTMGEAFILYEHTKLSLDDFVADEDDPKQKEALRKNILHPGTVFTRLVVSYLRGNPGVSQGAAEKIIRESNWLETYKQYLSMFDRGDAVPPAVAPGDNSSPSDPSGSTSGIDLGEPGETPEPIGTSE